MKSLSGSNSGNFGTAGNLQKNLAFFKVTLLAIVSHKYL